jgi:hypothetical protein
MADKGASRLKRDLTQTMQHLTQRYRRSTSTKLAQRAIRDFERFSLTQLRQEPFPATELAVAMYLSYSVTVREPALDSSTLATYAYGQSLLHDQLREVTNLPLQNPYRSRRVRKLLRHLQNNFKKTSRAKQPWSIRQARKMYACGFARTRSHNYPHST